MTAAEVVQAVQEAGGSLILTAEGRIKYAIPQPDVARLVEELRQQKSEVVALLRQKSAPPELPAGVRLVKWEPKQAPVAITKVSIVTDVPLFITTTLAQLQARLGGENFAAGNWSLRELVERLEQVGVEVEVEQSKLGDGGDQ